MLAWINRGSSTQIEILYEKKSHFLSLSMKSSLHKKSKKTKMKHFLYNSLDFRTTVKKIAKCFIFSMSILCQIRVNSVSRLTCEWKQLKYRCLMSACDYILSFLISSKINRFIL